jgi:hypothetical protein
MDAKQLYQTAESLFSKRSGLMGFWQETADNFYVERADFTVSRSLGEDFAANLMTSWPMMMRRDLGNQIGTMLRPSARPWYHTGVKNVDNIDNDAKKVLERMEEVQRKAMYDKRSLFARATKECDHDFAAFGQGVMSIELNRNADGLLYRCWHLRDVVWDENADGDIGSVYRKWKPTAHQAKTIFGDKLHQKVTDLAAKAPYEHVNFMHMVVDADMYDDKAGQMPRWSIWWDVDNSVLIEAVAIAGRHYIIPRWQTVSGSQYAYSPAAVAGIPDGRLLQAQTFTLLEAGEKAANPPMVATQNAVRSDMALYAGGVTMVDMEYDERLGDALRPLTQDLRGLSTGMELSREAKQMLHKAFFLDTLTMERGGPEKTAYEVGQMVQEYVRNALPIFEPMEMSYNGALCEETWDVLFRAGAFGNPTSWPESLSGKEIEFSFESPLHDAIKQQKTQIFRESQALISEAIALDPSLGTVPKAEVALREALHGLGTPSEWLNSEDEVQAMRDKQQQQVTAQQQLDAMEQGAKITKDLGGVNAAEQLGGL